MEKLVQATGVTMGVLERRVPVAERLQSEARFGSQPRSKSGASMEMVPPSRPRNRMRDAGAGMSDRLALRIGFRRGPIALRGDRGEKSEARGGVPRMPEAGEDGIP